MTEFAVPRVEISSLSLGNQIGSGGQGRVVEVSGFRINGEWPAVLKIYSPVTAAQLNAPALEKIVWLPRRLPPGDATWLQQNTAWPAVIAENQGVVSGFLMRTVPSPFYFSFQTRTLGIRQQLADTAFLLNSDSYVSSAGLVVSDRDRLILLISLAATLSRLHGLGVAVGDLSPKNILFCPKPSPSCFLIDCDAVQLQGESVLKQIETPDWEVPDGEPKATAASDAYKLGLLAIRLFARDQSSRDPAALTALSADLGRLAELSQDPDPARRPRPAAWASALTAAARTAPAAPTAPTLASQPSPKISVPIPPLAASAPASGYSPPRPRPAGRWLIAVAVAVLAVLGAAVALPRLLAAPAGPPARQAVSTHPSTQHHTSSLPADWTAYNDPRIFSIRLPPNWAISARNGTVVQFTGPAAGFVVIVAWTSHPRPDQLSDWRHQAAAKAQADPTYQQIRIHRVFYRGYNAADWEFTNIYQGALTHVLDHGFIVRPGRLAYAIELYGPQRRWHSVYAKVWRGLLQSFRPRN